MIKVSAPVRIDISAGWSDSDPYRRDYGSYVLNAAINLRVSAKLEEGRLTGSVEGVPNSSGLGTSAAIRTALILTQNKELYCDKDDLIRRVWVYENRVINQRAGTQDEAAAVYGGVNLWRFGNGEGEKVSISRTPVPREKADNLENKLVLVDTRESCLSSNIHKLVFGAGNYEKNIPRLDRMKIIAVKMVGKINDVYEMARLINETWGLQRELHDSIESEKMRVLQKELKGYYDACRAVGSGGKGCMIFYSVDKERLTDGLKKLEQKLDIKTIEFKFDYEGVILDYHS